MQGYRAQRPPTTIDPTCGGGRARPVSQHVQMNVADKALLYVEARRVLQAFVPNFESKAQNLTAALADGRLRAIQGIARAV